MSKLKHIQINISSSSVKRLRCKYCGNDGRLYSDYSGGKLTKFPKKNLEAVPSRYSFGFPDKRICIDSTHKLLSKSYNPSKSKNINKNKIGENLYCLECMMSRFSVKEKSVADNKATINRRGRYNYPDKIVS
jgi:hypothetical protein